MKKRGQFYFIAIIIVAAMVVGIITTSNFVLPKQVPHFLSEKEHIDFERGQLLDYLTIHVEEEEEETQEFANAYIEKFGTDKNTIFLITTETNFQLKGHKIQDSNVEIKIDGSNSIEVTADEFGNLDETYPKPINNFIITIDDVSHDFEATDTKNINYIINYKDKDEEVFTIHG